MIQEAKMHKENVANLEKRSSELEVELQAAALAIPNISHPAVPVYTKTPINPCNSINFYN